MSSLAWMTHDYLSRIFTFSEDQLKREMMDNLYHEAWSEHKWREQRDAEMMTKAAPYLEDMSVEAKEAERDAERHDELMQHYYEAHLRRLKPSRQRSFYPRV